MEMDRIIGELKEFKRATLGELAEIKRDIKTLNNFKWRVAGGAAILSLALTIAAQLVSSWFTKGR